VTCAAPLIPHRELYAGAEKSEWVCRKDCDGILWDLSPGWLSAYVGARAWVEVALSYRAVDVRV
jgi:hypothetical protein